MCIYSVFFLICSVQPCEVGEPALGGSSWSDPMPSIDGEAVSLTTARQETRQRLFSSSCFFFTCCYRHSLASEEESDSPYQTELKPSGTVEMSPHFQDFRGCEASVKPAVININFLFKSINKIGFFFPIWELFMALYQNKKAR